MNFCVCTAGTYRATEILGGVQTAFFNYYYFSEVTYMSDEIVLMRIMTALDVEFKRALNYHDKGYYSDNDYYQVHLWGLYMFI